MEINKKFLVKYLGDQEYDDTELTGFDIPDVISEIAGDFKFTDGWQHDVSITINEIKLNEEYEVYGQLEYIDVKMFIIKRTA